MLITLLQLGLSPQQIVYYLIILIFALTLSFSVHEFMHAAVAVWLGDPTPRNMGRLTLNPIAHVDPIGTLLLLIAGFGWGKPVLYNPSNLYRLKSSRGMNIMVHLAGVTGNFIVAIISAILTLIFGALTMRFGESPAGYAFGALTDVFDYTETFSMMLLAFNLLPIPPLDGFHVLEECLPYKVRSTPGYRQFERFAPMIIWVVFLLGMVSRLSVIGIAVSIIEIPFQWIIDLISIPFVKLVPLIAGM